MAHYVEKDNRAQCPVCAYKGRVFDFCFTLPTPQGCAATPWNYDLDAAPVGKSRLVLHKWMGGSLQWVDGVKFASGKWYPSYSYTTPIVDPIAWAEVNIPKEKEDE